MSSRLVASSLRASSGLAPRRGRRDLTKVSQLGEAAAIDRLSSFFPFYFSFLKLFSFLFPSCFHFFLFRFENCFHYYFLSLLHPSMRVNTKHKGEKDTFFLYVKEKKSSQVHKVLVIVGFRGKVIVRSLTLLCMRLFLNP